MEFSARLVLLVVLGVFSAVSEASRGDTIPPGQIDSSGPDGSLTTGTDGQGNCVYSFHVPIDAINLRPCPDSGSAQAVAQLRADMAAQDVAANTRINQLVEQVELLQESLAAQQRHIEALQRTAAAQSSRSPNRLPGILRPRRLF